MLVTEPIGRITAIDALMHDFCIINKVNSQLPIEWTERPMMAPDRFRLHYSLDLEGGLKFRSTNSLIRQITPINNKNTLDDSISDTVNELSFVLKDNSQWTGLHSLEADILKLLSINTKKVPQNELSAKGSSLSTKKSKFAKY
jgi:hypothetical protein